MQRSDKQQLSVLVQQLPKLAFDPALDCHWVQTDIVQAYLDLYNINFATEFAGAMHGFGYVDAVGFRIATQYWLPEKADGTLVVIHGYYDHIGIFDNVIRFALQRNLAVLAFDLPGHGLSSGDPAVIDSFNQYADVLAQILQQSDAILPQPLHAFGQSTGCAVVLNYLWRYAIEQHSVDRFRKIILCAPLVLARGWRGVYMGRFIYAAMRHFVQYLHRGRARSSHDPEFNKFIMHHDCLQAKRLSLRWVGAMEEWNRLFRNFAPLQKEVFVVQGTGDLTVDWRYNVPLIKQKLPQAKIHMIAEAGHQLINESNEYRTQVFAAIDQYLSS